MSAAQKSSVFNLVGIKGLEPLTSSMWTKRSNQLSHIPSYIGKVYYKAKRGNLQVIFIENSNFLTASAYN